MTEEENDQIQLYLNAFNEFGDDCPDLTDWERSFMEDQVKRYDQYGDRTRFSEKQLDIMQRVYGKLPI